MHGHASNKHGAPFARYFLTLSIVGGGLVFQWNALLFVCHHNDLLIHLAGTSELFRPALASIAV